MQYMGPALVAHTSTRSVASFTSLQIHCIISFIRLDMHSITLLQRDNCKRIPIEMTHKKRQQRKTKTKNIALVYAMTFNVKQYID